MMNNYNTKDVALLLTQYERFGEITREDMIDLYIGEELEVTADMVSDYNDYLSEKNYFDDYIYTDLVEMCEGMDAQQIANAVFFGSYNGLSEFFQFDGYGNIKGFQEYELVEMLRNDHDFLAWYVEENFLIDWDEFEEAKAQALELVAAGY